MQKQKKRADVRNEIEKQLTIDRKLQKTIDSGWINDLLRDAVRDAVKELQRDDESESAAKKQKHDDNNNQ